MQPEKKAAKVAQPMPKPAPSADPLEGEITDAIGAVRTLRSVALALLPELDCLTPDELLVAKAELEFLSQILDLAFNLVSRKAAA